jgi:hypothetical protein
VGSKVFIKVEDPATSFAWRGRAVEAGVNSILIDDASDSVAIERARHTFELSALGERSPRIDRDRQAIAGMVQRAGALFRRQAARLRAVKFDGRGGHIPSGYGAVNLPLIVRARELRL